MKVITSTFGDRRFNTNVIFNSTEANIAAKKLLNHPRRKMGIDIETAKHPDYLDHSQAGLCPHLSSIRLMQIFDGEEAWVFDVWKTGLACLAELLRKKEFIAHYAIFEAKHFAHAGFPKMNLDCSMLMAMLVDRAERSPNEPIEEEEPDEDEEPDGMARYKYRGYGLDACTARLFNERISKTEQTSNWNSPELRKEQLIYAGLDALLTFEIAQKLAPKIQSYGMVNAYLLLKKTQHAVVQMELKGFPVDWAEHSRLSGVWEKELKKAQKTCKRFFGDTNLRSGKQMGEWLTRTAKKETLERWPRTKKGAFTFNRNQIVDWWDVPAVKALLDYKEYDKLVTTYGVGLAKHRHPITDRIHSSISLGETRTGRMASRNPNLQNLPSAREVRNIFTAPEGHLLVVCDFKQIENRIQAEVSRDPVMRKVFANKGDIYVTMATSILGRPPKDKTERKNAGKVPVLALGYGMGATKLTHYAALQGIRLSMDKAYHYHGSYHQLFKGYSSWCSEERERCKHLGFSRTKFGRMRRLVEEELFTRAPNTVIQGSACEMLMDSANRTCDGLNEREELVNLVHDETIVCCPEEDGEHAAHIVENAMRDAMRAMFPDASSFDVADAEINRRWGDAKGD